MPIKTLGSLGKIRVGRVTGNTHIFFFGLINNDANSCRLHDKYEGVIGARTFEPCRDKTCLWIDTNRKCCCCVWDFTALELLDTFMSYLARSSILAILLLGKPPGDSLPVLSAYSFAII